MILWPGWGTQKDLSLEKKNKTRFITTNYDLFTLSFSKKANQFSSNPKVTI